MAPDHRRRERQQRSKPITEALAVWAYAVLDSQYHRRFDGSGRFGDPGPGQEFVEAAVGPVVDELGQHVGEV